ncbi:MAG: TIGR01777 family oxidoreductase [Pirellulaceae bacterium]
MRIAVSGSNGFVGTALCRRLEQLGHTILRLERPQSNGAGSHRSDASQSKTSKSHISIAWDPMTGLLDPAAMEAVDAVVHLAGRSIASRRWTAAEKQRIRDSRVAATAKLVEQIGALERAPRVFVSASAVGFYGDGGDEILTENSPVADSFLASVSADWEAATWPLKDCGVRVCNARLGIVMDREGGALSKALPIFRWCVGGRLGDGQQFWSWIALEDCIRALIWLVNTETAQGPYNLVAPEPVTNQEFTQWLGQSLGKPTWLPTPAFLLRLAMGEMADALVLCSCRAIPQRLQAEGFEFAWPRLQPFLNAQLGNASVETA